MKIRFGYFLLCFVLYACAQNDEEPVLVDLGTVSDCDVTRQSCTVTENEMSLTLALGPNVKALKPFPVQFGIEGGSSSDIENVVVDFQMEGMDMGINRYRLLQDDDRQWRGTATLPVCTVSRMEWYAELEFMRGDKRYRLRFPFAVDTN